MYERMLVIHLKKVKKSNVQFLDAAYVCWIYSSGLKMIFLNKGGLFILIDNHFQLHSNQLFS